MREAKQAETALPVRGAPIAVRRTAVGHSGPATGALGLQRLVGNRATSGLLQRKLTVGAPNDRYEQEADRVAAQVMRTAAPAETSAAEPGLPHVQRCGCGGSCADCGSGDEEESAPLIQPMRVSASPAGVAQRESTESCAIKEEPEEEEAEAAEPAKGAAVQPKGRDDRPTTPEDFEARLGGHGGGGAALPESTRAFMESRFGYDFSPVRVHTGPSAHGLNRDLNSLAFTTGTDIYFAPGQYRPGQPAGDSLLAHELTHVVQQAGGGTATVLQRSDPDTIRRKVGPERKPYYRHTVSGAFVHHVLEKLLRGADKELVTEAAIPGADRFSPELNKIGVADLYKSQPAKTVTGVKGFREVKADEDVVSMNNPASIGGPDSIGTQPAVSSSPTRPARRKGARGWTGDFPEKVLLGEIKPLAPGLAGAGFVGAGIAQLDSYARGYKAFVKQVNTINGGLTRASIGVDRLSVTIPDAINYRQFYAQYGTPSKDSTVGTRRLWVYPFKTGVYVYFDLDKDHKGPPPDWITKQLTQIRGLRKGLSNKHPKADKMISGKFLPGGPRLVVSPASASPPVATPRVQRKPKGRSDTHWRDAGKAWEKQRATWSKEVRADLKGRFKSYRDKLEIDKELGLDDPRAKEEVKEYKSITFWSGRAGRFLGKVRFLMGTAFDKVHGVFETMREKMTGVRSRVKGLSESGFAAVGWRKTLIRVLVSAAKIALSRFVTESFNFFVECFQSAMDKVVARFQEDLSEKFAEELCQARKKFEETKTRLEKEWGDAITKLEEMVALISDAKHWVDIATGLITLIRIGVQVVSCLTPPALGCLWGLVVQVGLSAALGLIVGTQWFNDNIVNPTIRDLVRKYATPHYQTLINRALGDGLKEFHCHVSDASFSSLNFEATGGLKGGGLYAHRGAWENLHKPEILEAMREHFKDSDGKPASRAELKELLKSLEGLSPDEMKKVLESARSDGKVNVETAQIFATLTGIAKPSKIPGFETPPKPPAEPAPGTEKEEAKKPEAKPETRPGPTEAGPGATADAAGKNAGGGDGREVLRAEALSKPWDRKATQEFTWLVAQGMTPKGKYEKDQVVTVTIDMYFEDRPDPVTIADVKVVYLRRRTTKDSKGRFVPEFFVHFEKDWGVGDDIKVKGGPDTAHWYTFEVEDW